MPAMAMASKIPGARYLKKNGLVKGKIDQNQDPKVAFWTPIHAFERFFFCFLFEVFEGFSSGFLTAVLGDLFMFFSGALVAIQLFKLMTHSQFLLFFVCLVLWGSASLRLVHCFGCFKIVSLLFKSMLSSQFYI